MKIYEFQWNDGGKDWVFAPKKPEAKEFYISLKGLIEADLTECEVVIIPEKEWGEHFILDINETEPDPDEVEYNEEDYACGYKIEMSFKEYAEQNTTTDIIATTEF